MTTMTSDSSQLPSLEKRIAYYRRRFAKGVGKTPTVMQKLIIIRAATLTAQSEIVLADPAVSINDKIRADHAAERARRALQEMLDAVKREPSHNIPLRERLTAEVGR
jgi:hypothetical protein